MNLLRAVGNNPVGVVDSLGESALITTVLVGGLVVGGGAILVYETTVGLLNIYVQATSNAMSSKYCCDLRAKAKSNGVDLEDMAPPATLSGFAQMLYCRHCLDCNALRIMRAKASLSQALIANAPGSSFTGPVASDLSDLAMAAVGTTVDQMGSIFAKSPQVNGNTISWDYVDPGSAPCDLTRCRGFMPDASAY